MKKPTASRLPPHRPAPARDATGTSTWTPGDVADRIKEAMRVCATLPARGLTPAGYRVRWPSIPRSESAAWERELERVRALGLAAGTVAVRSHDRTTVREPMPDIAAITRTDETLEWLWAVDRERRTVLMARGAGARWDRIARRLRLSTRTVIRRWHSGIDAIAGRLNVKMIDATVPKTGPGEPSMNERA